MILKSVVQTAFSLGGYGHIVILFGQRKLTCTSVRYCFVALLSPFRAARMYASPELKALNASSKNLGSRKTALQRQWFMALSTSELVVDNLSTSSIGGASGARLVFGPASGPGFGAWLVEARLAVSPNIVRRGLFVLKRAQVLICLEGITPGIRGRAIPLR